MAKGRDISAKSLSIVSTVSLMHGVRLEISLY